MYGIFLYRAYKREIFNAKLDFFRFISVKAERFQKLHITERPSKGVLLFERHMCHVSRMNKNHFLPNIERELQL
ncbi:hypothetical protein MPTK1_2g09180 [Marchantia polymorpha subsp. ruderalis]|uniref:Uncharacterized protein n=1 Tax=Marchantia polymorpha TaxID=3197 RepID=A0A2R6XH53_MARPO|nr:hypothetical protein MARPO_0015s0201 [Marchantia polymorpha]BBN01656.1 hypothetical protein Mp_2g09180 [Marchantia polymorpha subsp. ruderalis]|eukprot:PTQ45422.1 hypothetical protein MARPO_0015s0201 [Marchantia polymorpha]